MKHKKTTRILEICVFTLLLLLTGCYSTQPKVFCNHILLETETTCYAYGYEDINTTTENIELWEDEYSETMDTLKQKYCGDAEGHATGVKTIKTLC